MNSVLDKVHHRKELLRGIFAVALIIVGITHFLRPEQYARIVPPPFPPLTSVYVSGFFEILGGIGLTIPFVSVAAAWGLISLFIAVFPANIYMTLHNIQVDGIPHNQLLYLIRLPFQAVLIAWAYWCTRQPETQRGASEFIKQTKLISKDV
ncbi:DoxX family protein [Nostoc sp. UHCC 0302]|uniref:DoxX family protein n=1 Tax=Nostoc sp. UHCC 0302 TaxID=3134896 RepID=UPI00311C94BF